MGVWYTTREDVKSALDIKETARSNSQIDRAIEASSRMVEGDLHRRFYPEIATRYFDWPQPAGNRSYRIWLNDNELVSLTGVTAAGVSQDVNNFFLEPQAYGPPYDRLETNRGTSTTFSAGQTDQRAIGVTGVYCGGPINESTYGVLASAIGSTTSTTVNVDGTTSAAVGVGSLLRIDSERLIVTGRRQLTTSQTLQANLDAKTSTVAVAVSDGTAYAIGETILIDSEYMLIVDVAGNNLIVKRQWDGSVLATHTSGATVYAPRQLVVSRGVLGTTAATHSLSAPVYNFMYPGPVNKLSLAYTLDQLLQERSGYARTVGSGDNQQEATGDALSRARKEAIVANGRRGRTVAI